MLLSDKNPQLYSGHLSWAEFERIAEKHDLNLLSITDLSLEEDYERFLNWLEDGSHGEMHYLENHLALRKDPSLLLPGAKSAIVVGFNYQLPKDLKPDGVPDIAQYAKFLDYHKFLKKLCLAYAKDLREEGMLSFDSDYRVLVDSAPLLERALAAKGDEGFIGKNTCYIHKVKGSYLFLAVILVQDSFLPANKPEKDGIGELSPLQTRQARTGCGSCRRCQVKCPTGALNKDYSIDAKLCLSYWTIENRGPIPLAIWPYLKTYYFGCDICQNVCPYNRNTPSTPRPDLVKFRENIDLKTIALMSEETYIKLFSSSPMTRAKRTGLRRNALIAMYVSGDKRLLEVVYQVEMEQDLEPALVETLAQIRTLLVE